MNRDTQLIFEAYKKTQQQLNEAPVSAPEDYGDLTSIKSKLENPGFPGRGKKYGHGALEKLKGDKEIEVLAKEIGDKILGLFHRQEHAVKGAKYAYYYPGDHKELTDLAANILKTDYGMGQLDAGFTARVIINNILGAVKSKDLNIPNRGEVITAAAKDGVEAVNDQKPETFNDVEPDDSAPEALTTEPTTNKYVELAKSRVFGAGEDGIEMQELAQEISQLYVQSDPEITNKGAVIRATGLIKGLINRNIFSLHGTTLIPGSAADEAGGTDSEDVDLDTDAYAAKKFGVGHEARPETGRNFWGNQE